MKGSRSSLIKRFAAFPERIAVAARVTTGAPPPDGEWTPEEVVRHLIAVETDVYQARLLDVAINDQPRWTWTEPRPWPGEPDLDLDGVLERFAAMRAATVANLVALDADGWARTGVHATYGRLDVGGVLGIAVDHDEEHLRGLAALEATTE
jgi:DinB family protein